MRQEIESLLQQLKDAYGGEPWFGRSVKALLNEVDERTAFKKLNGQHSILELLWHMITWREFTIHCLQPSPDRNLKYFEDLDWRSLDDNDPFLWQKGLNTLNETQGRLISLLEQADDSLLEKSVRERDYSYKKLLAGLIQHDIYHVGQIAFITKCLK
jgi:uncharacterized damage-inducible protein DinB